jgi:ankyrin repeat protein
LWASRNGHIDTVRQLAERGADVNTKGYGGMTPLHHAASNIHGDVLNGLLELGAAVDCEDDVGNQALHWACEK